MTGLALAGGRVAAAGDRRTIAALAGRGTRRWELRHDLAVLPAITDAHLHLASAARAAGEPDLTGLDRGGVAAAVGSAHRALVAAGDHRGWLRGHGWSADALGGTASRALLDAAAPGRPVALWAHDHHARWLSTEALRRAGLMGLDGRRARPEPPAGRIEVDDAGHPTGLLLEGAAGLVDAAIPEPDDEGLASAIAAYGRTLLALGVATVHDPGDVAPDPELRRGPRLYRRLARDRRLPLRVVGSVREEQLEAAIDDGFTTARSEPAPMDAGRPPRYQDGWLKLFADGSLGSRSAALLAPYEAEVDRAPVGGPRGMALRGREELGSLAGRAASAGIACQIHAIGDAAVRTALDVLAATPPVGGAHHRVEHAQLVHPDDLRRFGALGIAASAQPCHLLSDADAARRAWGTRTRWAFPLASLAAGGALIPFGTDAPVEPPDPWPGIAAAVSRLADRAAGVAFHREEALPLARALRAACLDGPRSLGVPDAGHLRPGARADLIVVPLAPLASPAVDAADLATLRPLATLVDGDVVHRSDGFDHE